MGLSAAEWTAVALSVRVALVAVAMSLPFGIALGWLLARRDFHGKWIVETAVNLTLVLPPVVTGYILLRLLGRQSWFGAWLEQALGVRIAFTWWAAAIASAALGFPLMVRATRLAFHGVDVRLEEAARSLGASPFDAFVRVSLPLARGGIVAGAILAFARSLGEFGATITFAGNIPGATQTLPLAVFSELNRAGGDGVFRLALVSVALAAAALAASEWLERRGARE